MIKRLGNISLICMVLFATTGFVVNKHYMNGELFSASLYSNPETCCVEDDFCACCSEESHVVKVDHSFLTSKEQLLERIQQPARHILDNITIPAFRIFTGTFYPVFTPPYPRAAIQEWLQIFLL
ncbi:MAG: hypothetical protein KGY60_08980 [Bacteroidales bacterium]|nr:hypothetical protein [Bacteroidales bacterium]